MPFSVLKLEFIGILYLCAASDLCCASDIACIASNLEFSHSVYGMTFTVSKGLHEASR